MISERPLTCHWICLVFCVITMKIKLSFSMLEVIFLIRHCLSSYILDDFNFWSNTYHWMIALFVMYNNYLLVVVIQTNGKISLATRSLLELERYICEIYQDDVEKCNICKKLCLKVGHLKSIVLDMTYSLANCLICSQSTLPWLILFEYHCLLIVNW